MLANDNLPIPEHEESQVRSVLYHKAQLYLTLDREHFANVSLGIKAPEPWDRPGHTPQRIAALEKFQQSLVERATPTPQPMRR